MENNNDKDKYIYIDYDCKKIIEKKDYYDILGLGKNASDNEIRNSYKKLAIKFHPDKNKSKLAEDAFKKISHSFYVLSNKEKKSNYDKYGTEEEVIISRNNLKNNFYKDNNYFNDIDIDIDPFVKYKITIYIIIFIYFITINNILIL
jgi:curved DNA-binding protein CbpA